MTLLERVLANNACFPVRESEKFSVHSESDRLLAAYEAEAEPSDELTYAVVRMLRYLKRYRAAMELMQRRRPMLPDKRREIDFYELELHYHGGERQLADRLLEKFLAAGGKMRPSWKKSIDKIHRRYALEDVWAQVARVENDLADLAIDVDLDDHLPLLREILGESNQAMQPLLFTRARLQALRRLQVSEAEPDLGVLRKYHSARLIFACGFGWSGSGSVSCFLSQHKQVRTPFGLSELGYLQGRGGRDGFLAFLQPGAIEAGDMRKRLARFCVESIVALRAINHHYSVLMQCCNGAPGRVPVLGALVDDFNALMLTQAALRDLDVRKRVLGAFFQRLLSVPGGSHVLLNNVFMAPKLALIDAMEDARFVVVQRDTRDQFVARRLESRDAGGQGLDEFEAMIGSARSAFQGIRGALLPQTMSGRMRLIRFEDFICEDEERGALLDWLELPRAGIVADPEKFDASVSVRNVGIHASHLGPAELASIDSRIGRYID